MANPVRLLMIEDDATHARLAVLSLNRSLRSQYDVTCVGTLAAGREKLSSEEFDAVVADLNLPDSSGSGIVAEVCDLTDCPVVVITSTAEVDEGLKSLELGAQDYVVKGAHGYATLDRAITYAIERHRISAQLQSRNQELADLLRHDAMTGALNRTEIFRRIDAARLALDAEPGQAALLFMDVDGFKQINDSHGHGWGDEVLCAVAGRLQGQVRERDAVARLGGDEFVVLLRDAPSSEFVSTIAQRFISAIGAPLRDGGQEFPGPRVTIGYVTFDSGHESADELIKRADQAMYAARRDATPTAQFQPKQDLALRSDELLEAVGAGELVVHYQKVWSCDPASSGIVGYEALVRWQHPDLGLVRPQDFIPMAEQAGIVAEVDQWVLESVVSQLADAAANSDGARWTAVNVSAHSLLRDGFVAAFMSSLEQAGWPAERIVVEVTETAEIASFDSARLVLDQLRARGVRVALDDFGAGYASIRNLYALPIDILKIDQGFVAGLSSGNRVNQVAARFLEGLVGLAKHLGLRVCAEGVETARQYRVLSDLGVDWAQGYWLSKPESAPDWGIADGDAERVSAMLSEEQMLPGQRQNDPLGENRIAAGTSAANQESAGDDR
ncbi:MAG: GGDEF domain-containing response regulator [Actinomycetia bacterium]|nr:GGDEF domain-containing response regulator [Actinomycetes bacterium]